jgi:quercetin dioxygenase-like cupin family protein
MAHEILTNRKMLAIGLGALVAPVLLSGSAGAASHDHPGHGIAPIPPVAPVESVVLARGAAGEFDIADEATGFHLQASESTDVVMVRSTVAPHSSTGWHTHAGPSIAVVTSGTERLIEPQYRDHGCTEETYTAGDAFVHPSDTHNVANDSDEPVVVYITYFVPEGSTPALIPADPPRGC